MYVSDDETKPTRKLDILPAFLEYSLLESMPRVEQTLDGRLGSSDQPL